jgi:hypothetical protein
MSSFIDAILATDFLLSELERDYPIISGQIISHKESETKVLFRRCDFFIDSFLKKQLKSTGMDIDRMRSKLLKNDSTNYLEGKKGAELFIGTAGAKTLGRGGTLQNIHWSEIAFYPNTEILNAEDIVIPAEQQVKPGIGKIFRETTGNMVYDFFYNSYYLGKKKNSEFKSRFFYWWKFGEYSSPVPDDFIPNQEEQELIERYNIPLGRIYWRHCKIEDATDRLKAMREYPNSELEAFLASGIQYFDAKILNKMETINVREELKHGNII